MATIGYFTSQIGKMVPPHDHDYRPVATRSGRIVSVCKACGKREA